MSPDFQNYNQSKLLFHDYSTRKIEKKMKKRKKAPTPSTYKEKGYKKREKEQQNSFFITRKKG